MFWSIAASQDRAPHADFWYQPVGVHTASGTSVTPASSLSLPAVYACVKVITDALMQVPLILYRRTPDGGKERATEDPRYRLVHDVPNQHQTSAEWREIMQHHLLLRGNAFARIYRNGLQQAAELGMPHHPDFVTVEPVETTEGLRYRYEFRKENGTVDERLNADEVLHLRGLGLGPDGISGLSPIALEREAVGAGLAAQDFIARFFKNDASPGGWIEHPEHFKDDETKRKFRASWQDSQTGANRHKTAVLEYGMKYHPLELKLVDAQFLELRKYQNLDVARVFRVPPHLIMELDRATFSNITQQDIEFVKFTLLPWLTRWERRLSFSLLNENERNDLFFEFLVDGLERGDATARSSYYNRGIQDGWLTRNEVRVKENMNPLPGLDAPLEPLNMTNPGGRNDRMDALLRNNAAVLLDKQIRNIQGLALDEAREVIAGDWQSVSRFMCCSLDAARQYSLQTAERMRDDTDVPLEEWKERQIEALMELP